MSRVNGHFTPTQKSILNILGDGKMHRREELHVCLPDELTSPQQINNHLTAIRKLLRLQGQDIMCRNIDKQVYYQWVRVVSLSHDE